MMNEYAPRSTTPPGPCTEPVFEQSAQMISLFANGRRLGILHMLMGKDRSAGELVKGSGGSFSAVSQQLKILTLGGLIERRRDGRNVYYSLKGPDAARILEVIQAFCAKGQSHPNEDQGKLETT